jgi:hypothetical protein
MDMPFRVGDRVTAIDDYTIGSVGIDNIGTIVKVYEDTFLDNGHYVIQWDNRGRATYEDLSGPNQWNVTFNQVELYLDFNTSNLKKDSKHYKVCLKVLQMQNKRKRNGYVF